MYLHATNHTKLFGYQSCKKDMGKVPVGRH